MTSPSCSKSRSTVPAKRRKRESTSEESVVIEAHLGNKLEELSKTLSDELEAVTTVTNIHMDEIEQEVRSLRNYKQKLNLLQAMNDIKAFMQRMILLECEIKQMLEELGISRRLERLDKRLDTLHDIKETLEALKAPSKESKSKRSETAPTDLDGKDVRVKSKVTPVPE
ncbi:hypothetical protein Aduo_005108 [Ancylostoma duodenale]